MANRKAKDVTKRAKQMKSEGYVYVYGYKGKTVTKSGVLALAKAYPSVFTRSIKAMALKKVGKVGIDCSGYVNEAAGTSHGGSTGIKEAFSDSHKVSDDSYVIDGMGIWHQGHIAIVEVDTNGDAWIDEAKGTAYDLTRTKWSERAKSFVIYGRISGVDYKGANVKGIGKVTAGKTKCNCVLYKKRDTKGGKYFGIDNGTYVSVIRDMGNGWSNVWYKGQKGYMKNSALALVGLSGYDTAKVKTKAYMRKRNKKASKKIETIPAGTKVKVISKRKYWTEVVVADVKGWISTKKIAF